MAGAPPVNGLHPPSIHSKPASLQRDGDRRVVAKRGALRASRQAPHPKLLLTDSPPLSLNLAQY